MTRAKVMQLSGRELDVAVAQAKGQHILTDEEMRDEALAVWKEQPECFFFTRGFIATRQLPDGAKCEQLFCSYHSSWQHAGPLLEEMSLSGYLIKRLPRPEIWAWARNGANIADGSTPQETICRAYVLWRLEQKAEAEAILRRLKGEQG